MRNKINLIIAIAAISMLACQFVSGQKIPDKVSASAEKIITEAEFENLENTARQKLESQNHRIKTVEEIYSGSKTVPDEVITTVEESSVKPDNFRVVEETKKSDGSISTTGFMMIGNDRYRRGTNGEWILDPRSGYGAGVGMGSGNGTIPVPQIYKFIGKSTLAGQPTLVYEVSGKRQRYFRQQFTESNEQTRYWFSEDGKLLRREGTDDYADLNLRVKTLVVNQYNADIKIQPPAVKNENASEKGDIRVKKMLEEGKVKYEVDEDDGVFKITVNTTQGRTQTVFIESKTKVYEGFEVRRISSIGYDAKGLFPIDVANILLADNARLAIGAWEINEVEKNKYIALYVAKVPTTLTYEQFFYTIGIVAGIADAREKDLNGKDLY